MGKRLSRLEKEQQKMRSAVWAELNTTMQALHANERAFQEAHDPFVIEQLTYEHAALRCRCRVLLRILRKEDAPCR